MFGTGENPLYNPIVLDNIAKNLSVSDLKNFRLVCHKWFNASLPTWRRTGVLRVKSGVHSRNDASCLRLQKFVGYLRYRERGSPNPLARLPCTQIKFTKCDVSLDAYDLWGKIGATLKYLHFEQCRIHGGNLPKDLVIAKIVFEKCPNLTTLKMTNNTEFAGCIVKVNRLTKNEMELEWRGFLPHGKLEQVCISSGIPEKLVVLLPLAVKLRNALISTNDRQFEIKASGEEEDSPSNNSTVGERILGQMITDRAERPKVCIGLIGGHLRLMDASH